IVRPQAERKSIRVTTDLGATAPCVLADAGRLRQVFWNLLINATKYSVGGYIEVTTSDDDDGGVGGVGKDSGVGMDLVTLAKLFRPFERQTPRPGDSNHGLGLGLGLSICKGIVDAHHGRIWATSAGLGLGSTFEIDLPTLDVAEPLVAEGTKASAATSPA